MGKVLGSALRMSAEQCPQPSACPNCADSNELHFSPCESTECEEYFTIQKALGWERERMKTMKIHEKITYSTKVKAKQKGLRQALQQEEKEVAGKQATNEERLKALQESLLREIASKKGREQLVSLQWCLKQEEIQRLEKIAKNEERKLKKAEYHLNKDAAIFEEFLKEDQKICKEPVSTGNKLLTNSVPFSQPSDISQFTIDLQEYEMYRNFLHQLSLKEWQGEHSKRYTSTRDVKTAPNAREGGASPPITAEQGECQGRAAHPSLGQPRALRVHLSLPPGQDGIAGTDAVSPCSTNNMDDPELYFTDPQQLLSFFTEMKDENLSFIQKSQETEESLDKVQKIFITTHESMEKELAELKEEVATLKSSIAKEEERAADMKLKAHLFSSGECKADDQDNVLASLSKKVQEVYCQCTGESEGNLQTVQMLMVLEKQLNDLLDILERIPPEKIEHVKKLKEKERRLNPCMSQPVAHSCIRKDLEATLEKGKIWNNDNNNNSTNKSRFEDENNHLKKTIYSNNI
uniref:Cilia and flagella associated protein 100 n=1 Tax=Strigops habroptila TaxID=2489341 RepID=A0A672V5W7_STRHB